MKNILTQHEINQFKEDGAVFLKGKFSSQWIDELTHGIDTIHGAFKPTLF